MPLKIVKPGPKKVLTLKSKKEPRNDKSQGRQNALAESMGSLTLQETPSMSIRRASDELYVSNLKVSKRHFALSKHGYFALADCDVNGNLTKRYCIVQKLGFTDGKDWDHVYVCSCENNLQTRLRLTSCTRTIQYEPLTDFIQKERSKFCIHTKHIDRLEECNTHYDSSETDGAFANEDDCVDQLSSSPLIVSVYCESTGYGILQRDRSGNVRMRCQTCTSNLYACDHISAYRQWTKSENIDIDVELNFLDDEDEDNKNTYTSVSSLKIPFPLPIDLQLRYDEYETQRRQFPTRFIPKISQEVCDHGNQWDTRDPVEMGWIASASVTIHKMHGSINSDDDQPMYVYAIPTIGNCKCELQYDGQQDLLFNLDNRNLVYYGVLFQYLHTMVHTGSPLVSVHRQMYFTNKSMSGLEIVPLKILRRAWNAFARLLAIDLCKAFKCKECGPSPTIVICDATDVGMRKDFLPQIRDNQNVSALPKISGIEHKDRTYIKSTACRKTLMKLSGDNQHKRRNLASIKPFSFNLSSSELKELNKLLKEEKKDGLLELIEEISAAGVVAPHYRVLLSELSRNTPVYGILQPGVDDGCLKLLRQVAETGTNVRQSVHMENLSTLQQKLPVIAYVLSGCSDVIPSPVGKILKNLLNMYDKISKLPSSLPNAYSKVQSENKFDAFPTLPVLHGKGHYKTDSQKHSSTEECRKESWGHPTLTPGIFTVYCPHGVCYGFTIMESCESPKQPFDIFKTRFAKAPEVIVYDNACKLHQYCLLREPLFFKLTIFLVDRFHWKGHVGCSLGYNMTLYLANQMIKDVNSQVNEQGNAGIQKLKGHLSYMSFDNFKFHVTLYYSVKNLNVIHDVTYRN